MEKKIIKTTRFKNVINGYGLDVEFLDHQDGRMRKHYYLVDNVNMAKVYIWADIDFADLSVEEEKASIKENLGNEINGYITAFEAATNILKDESYFESSEEDEKKTKFRTT